MSADEAQQNAPSGAVTDVWDGVKVEPKRDRFGRYLIGGKPYTRVTTWAETVDDRYNLELWKMRMVAVGLGVRHDLYAQVASTDTSDKKKLNALCDQAIEAAKGSEGANLGTALHAFTERADRGIDIPVPPPWDARIAEYTATLAAAGVRVVPGMVERIVALHELGVAGTFDRLVTIEGRSLPLIADVKTGSTLDFSWTTIAIQLGCYANADDLYNPADDSLSPFPEVDRQRALVIHMPAAGEGCTLHLVDIAAGWEAAQLCGRVRGWRKRKELAVPLEPCTPTSGLVERVRRLQQVEPTALVHLAERWPAGVPTLKQGGHTPGQLAAIDTLIGEVEVAFLPARPDPEQVALVVARLRALPADLLAEVTTAAKAEDVPNLESHKTTVVHVELVDTLLEPVEAAARERAGRVALLLAECLEHADSVAKVCDCEWPATEAQVETLATVVAAVGKTLRFDDLGLDVIDGPNHLKTLFGGAREAIAAAKDVAVLLGLPAPRSIADVAGHPALFACTAARATTRKEAAA